MSRTVYFEGARSFIQSHDPLEKYAKETHLVPDNYIVFATNMKKYSEARKVCKTTKKLVKPQPFLLLLGLENVDERLQTESSMVITSKTRKLAAIGLFAALAIILNRVVVVPAPYLPFLSYEIWEVPLVVAFLAFGVTVALPAVMMNFLILLLFPGVILAGPLYNLIAILSMLSGIRLAQKLLRLQKRSSVSRRVALSTFLGIASRVSIMTVVNLSLLQLPPPLGFSAPASIVYNWLPLIGFFNGTVALYTVPSAYAITKAVYARARLLNGLI